MRSRRSTVLTVGLIGVLFLTLSAQAQQGKKKPAPNPATTAAMVVIDDAGRVASDGGGPYLGYPTPEGADPNLAGGVGPECSRVYTNRDGNFVLRTRTSLECSVPEQRRATIDLSDVVGTCPSNLEKTENGDTRTLWTCQSNLVDDVEIRVDGLFSVNDGDSVIATVYLALHSPPDVNTTHFVIRYDQLLQVGVNGDGSRTLVTSPGDGDVATLYDLQQSSGRGRPRPVEVPVASYRLPLSLTVTECSTCGG